MSNSYENNAYDGSIARDIDENLSKIEIAQFQEEIAEPKGFVHTFNEYPKSIFFIVGNEFCERFSFIGLQVVLTLYLINILQFNDDDATALFHSFAVLACATPILGSILADGFIGKFHTILWISLIYACGNIVLAFASTQHHHVHPWLDILGLLIISFGTGGIKPCVAAFGGDQFKKGQERMLETFFSVFYFSINAGGCISGFITPILRVQQCFGRDTCYPLAFLIPAVLMIISCIVFVVGSRWYKRKPPTENILVVFIKVLYVAIRNKIQSDTKRGHWTEHYLDTHVCEKDAKCENQKSCQKVQFVKDARAVLRLLVMYIPLPFFWALYGQMGSRWVIQATQMDGYLGNYVLLPDQIGIANTVLILMCIPLFSGILYPLTAKCVTVTPLRKMVVGGFLAVFAFIIAGFVQLEVDKSLPVIPSGNQFRLDISNSAACEITASLKFYNALLTDDSKWDIKHAEHLDIFPKLFSVVDKRTSSLTVDLACRNDNAISPTNYTIMGGGESGAIYLTVFEKMENNKRTFFVTEGDASTEKPKQAEGKSKLSFTYSDVDPAKDYGIQICLLSSSGYCDGGEGRNYTSSFDNITFASDYISVKPEEMWYMFLYTKGKVSHNRQPCGNFSLNGQGGIYAMSIYPNLFSNKFETVLYPLADKNTVSILMQLPQYVVITAAEILFSITGLEFSYSQAPPTMKSVMQAMFLLTISMGNVIIIIVAESNLFQDQAYEFFFFAGLMSLVMIIFTLLCQFYYEYVYYERDDDDNTSDVKNEITHTVAGNIEVKF